MIDKNPTTFFDTAFVFLYITLCDLEVCSINRIGDLNKENKGFDHMIEYLLSLRRMITLDLDPNCNLPELIKKMNQERNQQK